jgi:hypothetical protein
VCFCFIASRADGLKVRLIICPAFGFGNDVIANTCISTVKINESELAHFQTLLASILIAFEYLLSLALPWPAATACLHCDWLLPCWFVWTLTGMHLLTAIAPAFWLGCHD